MATPARQSRYSAAPTPASAAPTRRAARTPAPRPSSPPGAPTTASRAPVAAAALPVYQPPSCPLNEQATVALRQLHHRLDLDPLKKHLVDASTLLSTSASEIIDRYQARRLKPRSSQATDAAAERTNELHAEVERMVKALESETRRTIDAQMRVEAGEAALEKVVTEMRRDAGPVAPTQSTLGASQFRPSRRTTHGEEDQNEGSDADEDTPSQPAPVGAKTRLDQMMADWEANWEAKSLSARYAKNNNYIQYKRSVHDASFPSDEAPPLPHRSTWFPAEPSAQDAEVDDDHHHHGPSGTAPPPRPSKASRRAQDDSSDVEAVSERISIKCPLTLLPIRDAVSSKKCPHSFEKEAIEDMLGRSRMTTLGVRAIQCPVCEAQLTSNDLAPDPVLQRRIKRIGQMAALAEKRARDALEEEEEREGAATGGRPSLVERDARSLGRKDRARDVEVKKEKLRTLASNTGAGAGADDEAAEEEAEEEEVEEGDHHQQENEEME